MLFDIFVNQQLTRIAAKKYEKSVSGVWWVCVKALPLQPQSREIRDKLEIVKIKMRLETHFDFLKKNSKKFGGFKNSPYLCIRFLDESYKEEFFERFRYEQASSTRLTKISK